MRVFFSYFSAFLRKIAPVFPVFAGILCIATVAWLSNTSEELETRECTIYAVHIGESRGTVHYRLETLECGSVYFSGTKEKWKNGSYEKLVNHKVHVQLYKYLGDTTSAEMPGDSFEVVTS